MTKRYISAEDRSGRVHSPGNYPHRPEGYSRPCAFCVDDSAPRRVLYEGKMVAACETCAAAWRRTPKRVAKGKARTPMRLDDATMDAFEVVRRHYGVSLSELRQHGKLTHGMGNRREARDMALWLIKTASEKPSYLVAEHVPWSTKTVKLAVRDIKSCMDRGDRELQRTAQDLLNQMGEQ